jgi:2'-5' RNA ligase
MEDNSTLILTLRLDEASQKFFDALRKRHFPAERNFLKAHLTMFHKLPDAIETIDRLNSISVSPMELQVTGLINLGAGVAYGLESSALTQLHKRLTAEFSNYLSPQDKQAFRPHITIQNKSRPDAAKALLKELAVSFQTFTVQAFGLDLWHYLGGPWAHRTYFPFV